MQPKSFSMRRATGFMPAMLTPPLVLVLVLMLEIVMFVVGGGYPHICGQETVVAQLPARCARGLILPVP